MTRLLFCKNDSPRRESFWQKDNLITHILFELQPIIIFSQVANFGDQSLLILDLARKVAFCTANLRFLINVSRCTSLKKVLQGLDVAHLNIVARIDILQKRL